MSLCQRVVFFSKAIPCVDVWNSAIRDRGFDLVLDSKCAIGRDEGCWPCVLCDFETSFELFAAAEADGNIGENWGTDFDGRDYHVLLCTSGSSDEITAALIAAAVLAEITDGMMLPEGDFESCWLSSDRAGEWLGRQMPNLLTALERDGYI